MRCAEGVRTSRTRRASCRRTGVVACAFVVTWLFGAGVAAAQTTTTTPPTTTAPVTTTESTTVPTTSTTVPATTTPTTSPPTTTLAPTTSSSSDDFPWVPVLIAVAAVVLIAIAIAALSRSRARRRATAGAWRQRAVDEIGEIGATTRLIASGTPVSAAMSQQVLTSLRTLDDLSGSAPDDGSRAPVHDAHQAVRSLSIALDADTAARTAQPPVEHAQLEAAAASLRSAANDADGVLRDAYHALTQRS